MSVPMILAPLFVQVIVTFVIGFWLAGLRGPAFRRGDVRSEDVDLRQPNWPRPVMQVNNSFISQFELPVLFYVLTILALITKHADLLFVVLAWIFVLSRLAHAWVHATSNNLKLRGPLFGIGAVVLAIMWLIFIVEIMFRLG
jgi:hypothetical protein